MFLQKLEAYMEQQKLLPADSSVLVGVSGGADSVCLLAALCELAESRRLQIHAVHVHHGIRGAEADRDAAYVQELCERLSVPCEVVYRDVPQLAKQWQMTVEEAARRVRYEIFAEKCEREGMDYIAVAHHREDQEETILMNLFRGSGLTGAAGMQPVNGRIVRPLLEMSRAEIEDYLNRREIPWCTDSTNADTDYTRNFLRRKLLPEIYEQFPQAGERLRHFAGIAGETDRYLQRQAEHFLEVHGGIAKEAFRQENPVLQPYILRCAMKQAGVPAKDVTAKHYESMGELCGKPVGHRISLPGGYEACSGYEQLVLREKNGAEEVPEGAAEPPILWSDRLRMCTEVFPYEKNRNFPKNAYTKWFDYDKITESAVLRTRQSGDRFSPLPHGSKKLKDYMIDGKIPRELRDRIPLVADGAQILWIVGCRMSEAYKVTEETKRILQITIREDEQRSCEQAGGNEDGR